MLIALFGISGVGKSTLAEAAVDRWPSFVVHVIASELIKCARQTDLSSDDIQRSSRDDVILNQNLLIREFKKREIEYANRVILFDGHSVVNNGDEIIEVPVEVVAELSPDLILFVKDAPRGIRDRRISDRKRRRIVGEYEQIREEQLLALDASKSFSRELSIPLRIFRPDSILVFEQFLEHYVVDLRRSLSE